MYICGGSIRKLEDTISTSSSLTKVVCR